MPELLIWSNVAIAAVVVIWLLARYNVWRWPRSSTLPRILMYHSVCRTEHSQGIKMDVSRFAGQIDWMANRGSRFVTVSELVAARDRSNMVAITFDDGYADNYLHAWPVLHRYGAPATIYLAPKIAGIDRLSANMIREMQADGVEFGAHTVTHCHLPSADDRTAREEIRASREVVEAITGRPCRTFAYPFGKYEPRHVDMVRDAGFESAVTTRKAIVPLEKSDLFQLPRLSMVGQMNRFEFWLTFSRGRYRV